MPKTIDAPSGLSFSLTEALGQVAWYDPAVVESRNGGTRIGLVDPANGDQVVYHKTDGGNRVTQWVHDQLTFPANLENPANAPVTLYYATSNSDLDITTSVGRLQVDGLFSGSPMDEATAQAMPTSVGRYRYLRWQLTTDGVLDSYLDATGTFETLRLPVVPITNISFRLDGVAFPGTVTVLQGGELTVRVVVYSRSLTTGGYDRVDLTGATLTFKAAPTFSSDLVLDLIATVTDATNGEAEFVLTSNETGSITPGFHTAQLVYDNGSGTRLAETMTLRVIDAL